jgi:hypothetical protein
LKFKNKLLESRHVWAFFGWLEQVQNLSIGMTHSSSWCWSGGENGSGVAGSGVAGSKSV